MDFSKIVNQRQSKTQQQVDVVVTTAAPGRQKPGPKPRATSKRNDPNWLAFTAFTTPETRERLQNVIHMAKLAGVSEPADQSEAIEAALQPYLDKMEKHLKAKLTDKLSV